MRPLLNSYWLSAVQCIDKTGESVCRWYWKISHWQRDVVSLPFFFVFSPPIQRSRMCVRVWRAATSSEKFTSRGILSSRRATGGTVPASVSDAGGWHPVWKNLKSWQWASASNEDSIIQTFSKTLLLVISSTEFTASAADPLKYDLTCVNEHKKTRASPSPVRSFGVGSAKHSSPLPGISALIRVRY